MYMVVYFKLPFFSILGELPFPLNIIFLPVLLLFVLFLVWSILTYLTDTHIDLNLFHLIYIKFKTNKAIKENSEGQTKRNREELEELAPTYTEKRKIQDKYKKVKKRNQDTRHEKLKEDLSFTKADIVESIPIS